MRAPAEPVCPRCGDTGYYENQAETHHCDCRIGRQERCVAILHATEDGRWLNADELLLVEHVVNGRRLTEAGEQQWAFLIQKIEV